MLYFAQILPDFCRIFQIRSRRNVQGTRRVPGGHPGGYPGGSPQFAFSRKTPHTAPPKKLASSSARPAAALRDLVPDYTLRCRGAHTPTMFPATTASSQPRLDRTNFRGLVREAVSKRNFSSKYAFESSRRDLHNALLCTALNSLFFKKLLDFCQNENFQKCC